MIRRPNTKAALGRVTQTGTDDYGDPVYSTVWALFDGIWWPGGSREVVGGQDQVTWHNTVCLPTGTVVKSTDTVIPVVTLDEFGNVLYLGDGTTPQGDQFVVDGQPTPWPANSAGWQHPFSVVVNLTRQTG